MLLRSTLGVACALVLAGCGDGGRAPAFGFRGMAPGMNASELQAAAAGAGIGAMACQPVAIRELAADQLCFTPDTSASTVNVTAMIQSADSMVSYLAIREAMIDPRTAYDALARDWGAPDTTIATGRRWRRGRWVATADTGERILTVWLSDTVTARVVALAGRAERFRAMGADTLPYAADAIALVDELRADSVGHPAPQLATEVTQPPTIVSCSKVPPPASLASRTGSVLLAYVVDTSGQVEPNSIRVLEATHRGFAPSAAASVRSCTLRPGRRGAQVVRTLVQQRVSFEAER